MTEDHSTGDYQAVGAAGHARQPGRELFDDLRANLESAARLISQIQRTLDAATQPGASAGPEHAGKRLQAAEEDVRDLSSRLVDSEHQVQRLMNLYVATYQLHGSLDPTVVRQTIAEVATNLLGAQSFVLLLRREESQGYEVALAAGLPVAGSDAFEGREYRGGDPLVDATLADGLIRFGPTDNSASLAAVPLRVEDEQVGALVVLKLLRQKPLLGSDDREMLDLLSAHAAAALFAAQLFSAKDRRLQTLESLVRLARGGQ